MGALREVNGQYDIERRLLAILFRRPDLLALHEGDLSEALFRDADFQTIYRAMVTAYRQDRRLTYTRVHHVLSDMDGADTAKTALLHITETPFVSDAEWDACLSILKDNARRRHMTDALHRALTLIHEQTHRPLDDVAADVQQLIMRATSQEGDPAPKTVQALLDDAVARLDERRAGKAPLGLRTGFPAIDTVLDGGFKRGDLIVLAASTSMGKTALALNWAYNIMHTTDVLIFSLEMNDTDIIDRILISATPVRASSYVRGLDDESYQRVLNTRAGLKSLLGAVIDRRGLTATNIASLSRQYKSVHNRLGLIIIDYLQLIQHVHERGQTHAVTVGNTVRSLRDLAGELDVPVLLLSQLSRSVSQRYDKRPQLSDLRDSGNIEEFADVVIFVHRPGYYDPDNDDGLTEIIFAKQRRGVRGKTVYLRFWPEQVRFTEIFADA